MAILAIISAFCGWFAVAIIAGSLLGKAVRRMADDGGDDAAADDVENDDA